MNSFTDVNSNEYQDHSFDLTKVEHQVEQKLHNSPDVTSLAKEINIKDTESIMNFGQNATQEISQFADKILHTIETTKVEDSGELINQLNKIMDKFEIKDFEEKKKTNFFQKIWKKAEDSINKLLEKYHTMGAEIDKIYVQLKEYEKEIKNSNSVLEEMFNKNMNYYESLEKYIQAGNLVLNDLKTNILPTLELQSQQSNDQINHLNLSNALQIVEMLEQRIYDLELAKNVSLQTMSQIKLIERGNYSLIRKINSAFIVTIPIFKQSLTQAITLKRQAIQAKNIKALDDKTNELLLKNAQDTAIQSKLITELSSGGTVKLETLEKTWEAIMQGIMETKQIQDEMRQKRLDGTKRLHEIQREFENKIIR